MKFGMAMPDFGTKKTTPDFPAGATWFNTSTPFSLTGNLKGQIVVLDFWTYCCINCIHLIPRLKKWEDEFAGMPVVFIGVHSPKFQNEKDAENIQNAIDRYEIKHAVVSDENHALWNAFGINAWPTMAIIGSDGQRAYQRSGETHNELQKTIHQLLEIGKREGTLAQALPDFYATPKQKTGTLSFPGKIDFDWKTRRLAIADSNHNRIVIAQMNGGQAKITEIIGNGSNGFADGTFSRAQFFRPQGLSWVQGALFVADTENHAIRKIDFEKKTVSTSGGNGTQAPHVPGINRQGTVILNSPWDILAHDEHLYIAMAGSHQIWSMRLADHRFEPFAGTGGENRIDGPRQLAFFAQPSGLSSDGEHLFIADSETSSIRQIGFSDKMVNTVTGAGGLFDFGSADGPLSKARFQHPIGLDYRDGKIYVADTYNHAIREIDWAKKNVRTIVGTKQKGKKICMIGDTECQDLPLNEPNDVLAVADGLLIADTNNHLLRKFDPKTRRLSDLQIE